MIDKKTFKRLLEFHFPLAFTQKNGENKRHVDKKNSNVKVRNKVHFTSLNFISQGKKLKGL